MKKNFIRRGLQSNEYGTHKSKQNTSYASNNPAWNVQTVEYI